MTIHRSLWLLGALAAAGCSIPDSDRSANARIDTLANGRLHVVNTGEPLWTPATAWRLEEDLRIGTAAADGPTEEQFARVFDLTTDSRGRIYVLDDMVRTVRVFDPDGTYSHDLGSPGDGPGELSGPVELSIGAGDTVWVADQGAARYSLFAPDGTFARILARPAFLMQIHGGALPRGRYVQWGFTFPEGGFGRVDLYPIRVGPTPEVADTFPPIEFTQRLMENDRPAVFFSPSPTGTVTADGSVWFGHTDAYEIHRRTLEGDTVITFVHPAEPHPLDETDRQWVAERVENQPTERRTVYLAALPEVRPIIEAIVPDGAGHVYVAVDVVGAPTGTALDVFQGGGAYLGRLSLPSGVWTDSPYAPVIHATRDHLYVVLTDELDVPYVARLRIIRP